MKSSANNHTRPKQRPRIQLRPRLIRFRVCIPTASSGIASGPKPVNVSMPRRNIRIRIHVRSRVIASSTGCSCAWHGACVRATGLLIIVFVCGCKRGPCPRRILATCQHLNDRRRCVDEGRDSVRTLDVHLERTHASLRWRTALIAGKATVFASCGVTVWSRYIQLL